MPVSYWKTEAARALRMARAAYKLGLQSVGDEEFERAAYYMRQIAGSL